MTTHTDSARTAGIAFQQNSEFLQALLDISGLLVVVIDGEGRILLFNRECESVTGYAADELLGRSIFETLIPEEERPGVQDIAGRLAGSESSNKFLNHWQTRNGARRLIEWRNTRLHDAEGNVCCIVGTGIDVTRRERARSDRHHSEMRLRQLVDAIPGLVAELDRDYRIRFANHGYREWFGLEPGEQVGRHVREVIGEDAFAVLRPHFDRALAGKRAIHHGQVPYARGGTRFIHGTYLPCFDPEGRIDGVYILAVDITEEQLLKQQLAWETRRSKTIIDHAMDGIVLIDERGIIQGFNPAAEKLFGYAAEEVVDRNVRMLMPEPDRSRHDDYIRHYRQTGEARIIGIGREVTGRHRDGTPIDLRLAIAEFIEDGVRFFVGFTQDIRDRKQAEREAREHFAELAHLTRVSAMGEVASGLAHELSQPLTAIGATVEACLTMTEQAELDPARLRPPLEQISQQGQRARQIIAQLRTFLRKGQPENFFPHEPRLLIENVLALLTHELEVADVSVTVEIDPQLEQVPVNRVQIEQVLFNLAKNAIDAMRESAEDRALTLQCRIEGDGSHCRFAVFDTGPGIGEEHSEKLFNPFFTTKADGLGQGLPICRSIVQRHGGSLDFENRPEAGAVFWFTLPLKRKDVH